MARKIRGKRQQRYTRKKYDFYEVIRYLRQQNVLLFRGRAAEDLSLRSVADQFALCRDISASCQRMSLLDADIALVEAQLERLSYRFHNSIIQ